MFPNGQYWHCSNLATINCFIITYTITNYIKILLNCTSGNNERSTLGRTTTNLYPLNACVECKNLTVHVPTECSTVGKWYRDPYNECSYYECNGAQKVRRLCAQGTAVPPDYQDESAVAPCSIFNNQACGKDMLH